MNEKCVTETLKYSPQGKKRVGNKSGYRTCKTTEKCASIPGRDKRNFSCDQSHHIQGPYSPVLSGNGGYFLRRLSGRSVKLHSPQSGAEVKNEERYTTFLHTTLRRGD